MQRLFDNSTKQWMEVPDEQVADGVASGRFSYDTRVAEIPVFSPDGKAWSIPTEDAQKAYSQGYQPYTQERSDVAASAANEEVVKNRFDSPTTAFAGGVVSGATGGLSDVALQAISPELGEARAASKAVNPISNVAGEIAGLVVPGSPFGKAVGAAGKVVEGGAAKLAVEAGLKYAEPAIARGAFEGAMFGLPSGVSTAVLGDPDQAAETLLSTVSEGALLGGALSGLGTLLQAARPVASAVAERGAEVATNAARRVARGVLPEELRPLASDVAMREATLSPEMRGFSKAAGKADDTLASAVRREESNLRSGVDAEIGVERSAARKLGEEATAAESDVAAARASSREDAASQLSGLTQRRTDLNRQLAETAKLDKDARRVARADLRNQIRDTEKSISAFRQEVSDVLSALKSSLKFETSEAIQGADDLLKQNANSILDARVKAYEIKNAKYNEMQKWLDPTDPYLDGVKTALHSPVDPGRLFTTVTDAKAAVDGLRSLPFRAANRVADDVENILKSLVGENALAAKDASTLSHVMDNKQLTGVDLFRTEDAIKRQLGRLYGVSRNPGEPVHQYYNTFRDKLFKEYGDLGAAANDASDAYRVFNAFNRATNNIKSGTDSVTLLRRTFTDPEKASAIDAISQMVPDLVPEFEALARARTGTKAYLKATENLENAIRQQHINASSTKLTPAQTMEAGLGLADPALETGFNRFQSVAERAAKTEARATDQIAQLVEQRATLEAQSRALVGRGAEIPEAMRQEISSLDGSIEAAKAAKRNPSVPQNLLDAAESTRAAQQNATGRVADIRDTARDLAVSSPTFRMQAEDLKALADKFFPGGKLATRAEDLTKLKTGYAQLVANGASPADKYLYMVKATGGDVTKEMERLAAAHPYYQALERLQTGTGASDVGQMIAKRAGRSIVGSVIGSAFGGPIGSAIGAAAGGMVGGANPVSVLRTLSTAEKAIASGVSATDTALRKAADAFNSSTARKIVAPIGAASGEKDRRQTVKNIVENLSTLNNSQTLTDKIGQAAGSAVPAELTAALTKQYGSQISFLLSKQPVDPLSTKYPIGRHLNPTYPDSEIRRFERYVDAASYPLKVVERIGQGAATPEEIETVRTLYPRLFDSLRTSIFDAVASSKTDLSYQQRLILGTTFDAITDPTMDPAFMARLYQGDFARTDQQAQATAGAAAEQRTKISKNSIADDIQSPVERATSEMT